MTLTLLLALSSRLLGTAFFVLLIAGIVSRVRRLRPHLAFRRRHVQAVAAGRFARGELDADAFRRLRDDLKDLV